WWAKIKAHLGDDLDQAIVESTLISMRIELADAFSLDVASDKDGGVTFNPVLVRKRNLAHRDSSVDPSLDSSLRDAEITEELLPKVFQERFADVFRRYGDVRTVYTLGDGRYAVLTEPLRLVLSVVRAKLVASAGGLYETPTQQFVKKSVSNWLLSWPVVRHLILEKPSVRYSSKTRPSVNGFLKSVSGSPNMCLGCSDQPRRGFPRRNSASRSARNTFSLKRRTFRSSVGSWNTRSRRAKNR